MLTTRRSGTEHNVWQTTDAVLLEGMVHIDYRASDPRWSSPVALVCNTALTDLIASLGPVLTLQPSVNEDQLRIHSPARLVIEEAFIFRSPWRRWVDDRNEVWGPLRAIAESFGSRRLPVYVASSPSQGEHLVLPMAQYLPNLRTKQLQAEFEFVEPLLALLQGYAPPASRGIP